MTTTLELKNLNLQTAAAEKADLLLLLLPRQAGAAKVGKTARAAKTGGAAALLDAIAAAEAAKDIDRSKAAQTLELYSVAQVAARRVVLVTSGEGSGPELRKALQAASGALRQESIQKAIVLSLHDGLSDAAVHALVLGLADAAYQYTATLSKAKPLALQSITIGMPDAAAVQPAFEAAEGIAAGVALAREWGNRPANLATPAALAEVARGLAKAKGVRVKVHGLREIERLKMGAFLAVAQGSVQEPQFIELHYQGAAKGEAPVVLVGKGVTFDTGGISIKPAAGMDEMKFDMCGAASVLGVFQALIRLQPKINVVGLIPATENMPGGKAIKPGDVVTSLSGQTIEILNTDAEGRLILCDALSYADRFKPRTVIDIATLTGACVVALGHVRSGLYATEDALAEALLQAGEATQDPGWRLPLDDEYGTGLKSNFADMANVAGRDGGSITAAKFLQRFVGDWPWAHLDIAGTAWKSGAAKGATGRPVGLLTRYLLGLAAQSAANKAAAVPAQPAARTTGRTARGK
ncbi:leucyl aminopeptidase [Corticibacter populi]|uniref:Probable cytosol aminopeptidase n=1 Tax=Corticibacter populi TaxID=1550736 RepID=A0A3M6QSI1_9BURK|nr:leucyl aminopeptidase [Corticibacter populi]RMX05994.1 leucyl aminopeptidase [Corticibacter populi]RZS30675.1 aminopeptidase A [Corticibacter populi]